MKVGSLRVALQLNIKKTQIMFTEQLDNFNFVNEEIKFLQTRRHGRDSCSIPFEWLPEEVGKGGPCPCPDCTASPERDPGNKCQLVSEAASWGMREGMCGMCDVSLEFVSFLSPYITCTFSKCVFFYLIYLGIRFMICRFQ